MATQKLAWRKPLNPQENESWVFLLINQGYYQLKSGDIPLSISCYEAAYQFFQRHPFDLNIEEYLLKPLSNNYTRLGDYERAIYIQKRSLDLALKANNKELASSVYCNLATSYRSKGDIKNAKETTKLGLAVANKNSDIYGLLLTNLADICNEESDYLLAKSYAFSAIKHLKARTQNESTKYWLLGAYTVAGDIELNMSNYPNAKKYYLLAKQRTSGQKGRELAYIFNQLGLISNKQGKNKQALRYYNEALKCLIADFKPRDDESLPAPKVLFAENKLQAALEGKADALERLAKYEASLQASILAFDVAEELRKEYTYKQSKQKLQAEVKALAERVIEKAYRLWLRTKSISYANDILLFSEKTKSRILFDELHDSQNRNLAVEKNPLFKVKVNTERLLSYYQKQQQTNPKTSNLKKILDLQFQLSSLQKQLNIKNPVLSEDVNTVLEKIPAQTEALIFFCGDKNTYIIRATNAGVSKVQNLGNSAAISKLVNDYLRKYFYNGPGAMVNAPQAFYSSSYNIYKTLLQQPALETKKLLVVKDGVLNFLPFESLITKPGKAPTIAKWPYLIKYTSVSYAFSLNSLSAKESSPTGGDKFIGLFLSKTGSSRSEIPAVAAEYKALKKLFKGKFLENEKANLVNFQAAVSNADILHLSSHSYLTDGLGEPVLELYQSKYYLLELNALQKVPALVVLSACQTADGVYLSGEGVLSFSRGFIAAGAKGVISGLWNVNDKSAADLMVNYYQNLASKSSTASALTRTKLQWLKDGHKSQLLLLPYYWDSLIFTGTDFNVALQKQDNFTLYIILSVFLTILLILFSQKRFRRYPNLWLKHLLNAWF
ncbi:MAG TPA: CHAT domain-containing protein [Pelobium sp.]